MWEIDAFLCFMSVNWISLGFWTSNWLNGWLIYPSFVLSDQTSFFMCTFLVTVHHRPDIQRYLLREFVIEGWTKKVVQQNKSSPPHLGLLPSILEFSITEHSKAEIKGGGWDPETIFIFALCFRSDTLKQTRSWMTQKRRVCFVLDKCIASSLWSLTAFMYLKMLEQFRNVRELLNIFLLCLGLLKWRLKAFLFTSDL